MHHVRILAVIFVALFVAPGGRRIAQSEVWFGLGLPASDATGKRIVASGAFSVEDGCSPVALTLLAVLPAGGRGGQQVCSVEGGGKNWSGQIDSAEFPRGTDYNVFALLTVVDRDGELHHYTSRTVAVRIP
jgi:hypothetical protein